LTKAGVVDVIKIPWKNLDLVKYFSARSEKGDILIVDRRAASLDVSIKADAVRRQNEHKKRAGKKECNKAISIC
jgi:hypothetical protein